MERNQRKRSGDRITGCLEPFEVEAFQAILSEIFSSGSVVAKELLELFRERSKIAFALRMRPAVDMNRPVKTISLGSRDIIINYLATHQHDTDTGMIICALRYFSGEKKHNISLKQNCACCNSKDPGKALAHARKDCEKYAKVYGGKILKQLQNKPWSNLSADEIKYYCMQYKAMGFSAKFVCAYLSKLCNGNLPRCLGAAEYSMACTYDAALANHYNHNASQSVFTLKPKRNHSCSTVNQECATYLFCATYR